ncbi:acetyl-CoA acetyltransferase [Actinomycetospora termitidis]|uniref:Acetyl-CoA acetyltransferase n=1 Tax=Actinomycetospora termitidis TaxID=3053470 RepID=A0ABT7MKR3_9PSEU|nr:acetyl-CoA acetyltransferase [Actinomycetospora sp. Odt1-22]MDL5159943.1 acetyl-CoA acetyltransferase [Actinomycetospora sp. Odt1-22]
MSDRTPVLVGVGQSSERLDDPGYRGLSPVDLGAGAARAALTDAGADPADLAARIDLIAAVRQFEMSAPGAEAPLGRSDNYPRSIGTRIGADPRRAVLEVVGGQSPQHLVTEAAAAIAAGEIDVALLVGAEAMSTVRRLLSSEADRPDWTEHVGGQLEDRGLGLESFIVPEQVENDVLTPVLQYALCEHARRARLGLSREDHRREMAELFAPLSEVAAKNPHAAAPTARSVDELATPSSDNRPIADPYLRHLVAREQVNQGAAVVLASAGTARELGVPDDRWVHLHGHADLVEPPLLDRADLGASPAAATAVRRALDLAGIGVDDLTTIDLYSCFPIAVRVVTDELGLAADDPRGLTVTGGLPFFGGPGNDYSMHAIADTVTALRARPGTFGLVGANGGAIHKYSAGVYSTRPTPWRPGDDAAAQAEVDAVHAQGPGQARRAEGAVTVETYTVEYGRDGRPYGAVVVGRLPDDGRRVLARVDPDDAATLEAFATTDPIGRSVHVRPAEKGHRVTLT